MSRSRNTPVCPSEDVLLRLTYSELESAVAAFIADHVERCSQCTAYVEDVREVRTAYSSIGTPSLPEAALDAMVKEATRSAGFGTSRPTGGVWLKAAILAGLTFSTGLLAGRTTGASPASPQVGNDSSAIWGPSYADPSAAVRLQAVSSLGQPGRPGPTEPSLLIWILETDPSPNVRLAAADALRTHELDTEHWERIAARLGREPLPSLRMALIDLLVDFDPDLSAQVLQNVAAIDEDPSVRRRASNALGLI